ncbi:MAG: hypothetical protein JRN52_01930 [Nitrososphaerota archaeon]|nr:hypothetical protein [Nitrososphaerota archaeon]
MRKGLLIVGALIMAFVLPVLVSGYERLATIASCENFGPCPIGLSPTDSGIAFLADAARMQVVYGVVFAVVSGILLIFGVFGSSKSQKDMLRG